MARQPAGSDGVVTEMVRSHLASAAEEMRRTLIRTAFNPVIYDVLDSASIHQEGVVFPGTKVYVRGEPVSQILEILRFNSRAPDILLGDLNAQIAAVRTGERRLHRIFEKFGLQPVKMSFEQLIER